MKARVNYVEELAAQDGTVFWVNSEQVRGEPRVFWIERRDVGAFRSVNDKTCDDTYSRATVCRQLARVVREWDEAHPVDEQR